MQRKVVLPVAQGDTLTFSFKNGRSPIHIMLTNIEMKDNRITWTFRSAERHTIYGSTAREQVVLPFFGEEGCYVCLSIPLRIHVGTDKLKPDFVLCIPSSVSVQSNDVSAKQYVYI